MKKISVILLTILLTPLLQPVAYAQEEEDQSVEESVAEETKDAIEKIKDAVASKVAELDLVEKRGIYGKVTESSTDEITIQEENGTQRIITIDELTRFEAEDDEEDFGISDIEKDTFISAVGLYNKDTEKLLARFITQKVNIPQYISGAIAAIDEENYTVTLIDNKDKEYLIDIETSTDTAVYDEEEMTDSGFSELEVGERAIVTALPNKNEENRYSAERLLHFRTIPPGDKVQKNLQENNSGSKKTTTPTEEE